MTDLTFGILTTCISSALWIGAFIQYKRRNFDLAIIFIVIAGAALRIYTGSDFFLHAWDERYHALVAKHMMSNPIQPMLYVNPVLQYDLTEWSGNHIWLHKQPFTLWMMALSLKIFGVNEFALRIPSILLSTLSILIVYKVGEYFGSKLIGLIAAFLFSVNGLIIELTAGREPTDHPDIFFMSFILFAVYQAILFSKTKANYHNILCAFFTGIAILCKWLPALIILPVWMLLVIDSKLLTRVQLAKNFSLLLIIIILVSLPWQIYILRNFQTEALLEYGHNVKHLTQALEEHDGSWWFYFDQMRINYGELVYLPILWFLLYYLRHQFSMRNIALLVWLAIPYVFFSFAKTKMQAYTLFSSPAIFIISGIFISFLIDWYRKRKSIWIAGSIALLLVIVPLRYCLERVKPFSMVNRNPQWTVDLRNIETITGAKSGIIFNAPHPIELMFYSDFVAYGNLPDVETIKALVNKGKQVFINQTNKPASEYLQLKGIRWISLSQ